MANVKGPPKLSMAVVFPTSVRFLRHSGTHSPSTRRALVFVNGMVHIFDLKIMLFLKLFNLVAIFEYLNFNLNFVVFCFFSEKDFYSM